MALRNSLRPARAMQLRVILPPPHDREILFAPLTLKQISAALWLDPEASAPPETKRETAKRLCDQAEILFGPENAHLTNVLTMAQVGEIVSGLYLSVHGIDPSDFVAVQQHLQAQRALQRTSEESLALVDDLVLELAAELRTTPASAEEMPMQDAVGLHERLATLAKAAATFDAALHDKKLES